MSFLGSHYKIDDFITWEVDTHLPGTAALVDADSVPTYEVYEDETTTPIVTGSMAKLNDAGTLGFYSERFQLTAVAGFELGKAYGIRVIAVVGGVTGGKTFKFQLPIPADVNLVTWLGTAPLALAANRVQSLAGAITDGILVAATFADDAITGNKLAASAITKIQALLALEASVQTILTRLSVARAGFLDFLNIGGSVASLAGQVIIIDAIAALASSPPPVDLSPVTVVTNKLATMIEEFPALSGVWRYTSGALTLGPVFSGNGAHSFDVFTEVDGTPIGSVLVTIQDEDGDNVAWNISTLPLGVASFNLNDGTYSVLVTPTAGYEHPVATPQIIAGGNEELTFDLVPQTIDPPALAGMCKVRFFVSLNHVAQSNYLCEAKLTGINQAVPDELLSSVIDSRYTNENGIAELTLIQQTQFTKGDGTYSVQVTAPDGNIVHIFFAIIPDVSVINAVDLIPPVTP